MRDKPSNVQLGRPRTQATDTRPRQVKTALIELRVQTPPSCGPAQTFWERGSLALYKALALVWGWGEGAGLQSDTRLGADGHGLPTHILEGTSLCSPATSGKEPIHAPSRRLSVAANQGHGQISRLWWPAGSHSHTLHCCPRVWPPVSRNRGLPETRPRSTAWLGCTLKD